MLWMEAAHSHPSFCLSVFIILWLLSFQHIQQYHINNAGNVFIFPPNREIKDRLDHPGLRGHRALLGLGGLQGTRARMGPEASPGYQ